MYGYVYVTTNKLNDKVYIGQHRKQEYDNAYYGSGQLIKQAIIDDGIDNFSNEILAQCQSQQEMNDKEKFYIKSFDSLYQNGKGYNISGGGNGGFILEGVSDEIWEKRLETYSKQNTGERNPNFGNGYKIAGDKNPSKRPEVKKRLSEKFSGKKQPDVWETS